jgi:hypothetical protein
MMGQVLPLDIFKRDPLVTLPNHERVTEEKLR